MSWKEILKSDEFCDECGDRIKDGESYPVESMPKDFHSGKKGESATLCEHCYDELGIPTKDWAKDLNPFLFMNVSRKPSDKKE